MANEPLDPATPDSGSGTSIEKFKSPEERDRAYLELEKFSHTQSQRLADLEKRLEDMASQPAPQPDPYAGRSFTEMYPSRTEQEQRERELASRLLTQPTQVLREHAELVRKQTMQDMAQQMDAQNAIYQFKADNPDLAKHEEIVAMFVRKQPENLKPTERLKRAAPEARKYLSDLVKTNTSPGTTLDPATYVESPSQRPSGTTSPVTTEPSEEDDLSSFIRERQAIQQKKRL